jgi:NAD(P)-dependent dehydrogenase (short-subunit alcohol dehydrogenase family)
MDKLKGKVALVTGGGSGIGLATAKRFVAEGAHVFIVGRRQETIENAAEGIGPNVTPVQGDVGKAGDLERIFSTIESLQGKLDVVFANAGLGYEQPIGEITEEQYYEVFDTNVKGTIFTVQNALPLMLDGGSIVLNASIAASMGDQSLSVYAATKAAVRSFARTWTSDLRKRRIRVNAISPGIVPTPGWRMTDSELEELARDYAPQIPAGRVGEPDEIAKAVVFLASDDSSFVTGIELVVDGGMTQI